MIDGEIVETTPEHPFYTAEGEWVNAADLQVGDQIHSLEGEYGTVERVTVITQTETMYNLTVNEAHTFFVGDGAWLVHNIPRCWVKGDRPPVNTWGLYKFADQIRDGLHYFGKGKSRTRVQYDHMKNGRVLESPSWENVEWMEIPYFEIDGLNFEDDILRAAERAAMFDASGGDINLLANDNWPLNDDLDILKRVFDNLPSVWPSELMPLDPKFFKVLPVRKR